MERSDEHPVPTTAEEPPFPWDPQRQLHSSAALALVASMGSALVAGMMAGLILLDATSLIGDRAFTGQGMLGAGVLAVFALAPGLACWAAGRRLMERRGHPALFAPRRVRVVAACLFFSGVALGALLGVPTP